MTTVYAQNIRTPEFRECVRSCTQHKQQERMTVKRKKTLTHCEVLPSPHLQFLPREAMLSAVFAVVVCLCVSVCLSHSGIVSKRLNVGSRKQRRMIAP